MQHPPLSANRYQLSFEKVLQYTFFVQKIFVSKNATPCKISDWHDF
jgi:hypothetical protein